MRRMTSPSNISTGCPWPLSSAATHAAMELLPEPDKPVNQTTAAPSRRWVTSRHPCGPQVTVKGVALEDNLRAVGRDDRITHVAVRRSESRERASLARAW